VTKGLLCTASKKLEQVDVVIGPAADGGYYLIGLRKFYQVLFQGIPWGLKRCCKAPWQRPAKKTFRWHCCHEKRSGYLGRYPGICLVGKIIKRSIG
jgi:hypothetical protein